MEYQQLENICQIIAGQSPPSRYYNKEGKGLPFFQGKADFGQLYPTVRSWCSQPKKVAKKGDILISVRAPVGPTNIADQQCCIGRGLSAIRASEKLDTKYLLYYLRCIEPVLSGRGRGSTFSAITQSELRSLQIPLPPLAEQKRIAAILDKADALRVKRRAAIARLDDLLQSVFLDMFGDPVSNPMGWDRLSINEVAEVKGGLQLSGKRKDYPIEMPYLRVANVYRDRLKLGKIKTLKVNERELKRTSLETGDILLVEGHGNPNEIGRTAVWDGSIKPCVHQNHLIRVQANRNKILPTYMSNYLNSEGGRRQLIRAGKTTSGLNTISSSQVRGTNVLVPPLDIQQTYLDCAYKIQAMKEKHSCGLEQLNSLFHALQQRVFKGEL